MSAERLSALDASFLAVESPASPLHVGWVAVHDPPGAGPSPTFAELFRHLAGRLESAPRYRQRLAGVPFGLHEPVWVDDPGFDPAEHLLPAGGSDLGAIVDAVLSTPLARDRSAPSPTAATTSPSRSSTCPATSRIPSSACGPSTARRRSGPATARRRTSTPPSRRSP